MKFPASVISGSRTVAGIAWSLPHRAVTPCHCGLHLGHGLSQNPLQSPHLIQLPCLLGLLWAVTVPQMSLFLMILAVLRTVVRCYRDCPSDVFLTVRLRLWVLGEDPRDEVPFWSRPDRGHVTSVQHHRDVDLVKVVPARFLHGKVPGFPRSAFIWKPIAKSSHPSGGILAPLGRHVCSDALGF